MTNHTDDLHDSPRSDDAEAPASGTHAGPQHSELSEEERQARQAERAARRSEREARRREREARREERRSRHEHRRKGRVIHTRVSEELSDDIRRLADDLRVPASNLIRNVLEEVFSVVESVSDDVGDLLGEVVEEAEEARDRLRGRIRGRPRSRGRRRRSARRSEEEIEAEFRSDERAEAGDSQRPEFPDVMGWQPLVLNRSSQCADCGRTLERGERAFLGLTGEGLSKITLCDPCTRGR